MAYSDHVYGLLSELARHELQGGEAVRGDRIRAIRAELAEHGYVPAEEPKKERADDTARESREEN